MSSNEGNQLLAAAKHVLASYRAQEDGVSDELVRIPFGTQLELEKKLALNLTNSARQVIVVDNENSTHKEFQHVVWRQRAGSCGIERIYTVPHAGFASAAISEHLAEDEAAGITSKVIAFSSIPADVRELCTSGFYILDGTTVAYRQTESARWIVCSRRQDIESAEESWGLLNEVPSLTEESSSSDVELEEPLVLSADLVHGVAPVICRGDHIDANDCSWYHGTWQYLRLLDLVSTPTWHHDFYMGQLSKAISSETDSAAIAITGTADYSMLAYAMSAARAVSNPAQYHIVDFCPTPLFACQWYGNKNNTAVATYATDFLEFSKNHASQFSVVCTDAFLTRFRDNDVKSVIDGWRNILRYEGRLITTVRLHNRALVARNSEDAVSDFRNRASQRASRWTQFLRIRSNEIAIQAERYARTMVSNPIGDENEVVRLLNEGGLKIIHSEVADVPGELYPSIYLRVVCAKA